MAYVYLDDGGPESGDYDSNYVYYDERRPASIRAAQRQLRARGYAQAARCLQSAAPASDERMLAVLKNAVRHLL